MKLVVRIFAFVVVAAGAAAASFSSTSSHTTPVMSHQTVVAALPSPGCGPGMGCPTLGK